jgi:hypothetical protein
MAKARTALLAAMFTLMALGVRAAPLACYTQFGDVRFTGPGHSVVLLPYNQCLRYIGHDGSYIRARAPLRGLSSAEGWIFEGDVHCGPGSCFRRH